jgi:hypothetical protein
MLMNANSVCSQAGCLLVCGLSRSNMQQTIERRELQIQIQM